MEDGNTALAESLPARHANQTPPALTSQKQSQFLELLSTSGRLKQSCVALDMGTNTPYEWAKRSMVFAKRFEAAKLAGEKVLLAEYEEKIHGRIDEGKADPQSAVLTMFRVKRLDPQYRDNAVVNVQAHGPVAIQLNFAQAAQAPTTSNDETE